MYIHKYFTLSNKTLQIIKNNIIKVLASCLLMTNEFLSIFIYKK